MHLLSGRFYETGDSWPYDTFKPYFEEKGTKTCFKYLQDMEHN